MFVCTTGLFWGGWGTDGAAQGDRGPLKADCGIINPRQDDVNTPPNAVMSSTCDAVTSSTFDAAERSHLKRPSKDYYERDRNSEKAILINEFL